MAANVLDRVDSIETDLLILVDEEDRVVGHLGKADCHRGEGVLHRAFSVFLFNERGELLLQQRAAAKPLWPLYWSNSCCSHPRWGESVSDAAHRRIGEELGASAELDYLYKFIYQAPFGDVGSEHELCSVFVGRYDGPITAPPAEVAAWRWIGPADLERELREQPERFTPWFKLEWPRLCGAYRDTLRALGVHL